MLNQTTYNSNRTRRILGRMKVADIEGLACTDAGWLGWCRLNNLWVGCYYRQSYVHFHKLHDALKYIGWKTFRESHHYLVP